MEDSYAAGSNIHELWIESDCCASYMMYDIAGNSMDWSKYSIAMKNYGKYLCSNISGATLKIPVGSSRNLVLY